MAVLSLSQNFQYFFSRLNPSLSFMRGAASEHQTITGLIENRDGPASVVSPRCFLQGSYKQQTAIHTINDIDIVALCELWQPGSGIGGRSWSRHEIFDTVAAPLLQDGRYRDKVHYSRTSMCIKVDLGIEVEILPAVYKAGNNVYTVEPFRLYRPEKGQWEDGFARYHQTYLSVMNRREATQSNFIPCIKAMKHIRSIFQIPTVSFHIECLLYSLPNEVFHGPPPDYLARVLAVLSAESAESWYSRVVMTPCGDRDIFTAAEWTRESWDQFHKAVTLWSQTAQVAINTTDRNLAIEAWQLILGKAYFPFECG